jgi:uncharacterized PurR-regulated membrane protein YhhQ (DUF165 family)
MTSNFLQDKPTKIFLFITAFFVANALIAECIGGKIFSLEKVFGLAPSNFSLFGQKGLSFNLTCGVLLWPLEFVITDIVNEYYGPKAVRRISYTAVILITYAFIMFYAAKNSNDSAVKAFAVKTLPVLYKHLGTAKAIEKSRP